MELPFTFIERTKNLLGNEYAAFECALQEDAPVSIRLNPEKNKTVLLSYDRVRWCNNGYFLSERPAFTFDPRFHAGAYYVQEASSMFLDLVLREYISAPVRYLDLCASPGGKSTLALSALPKGSLVVCNEVVRTRAHILAENVIKWGNPYCIVTNNDVSSFCGLKHYFDVILVDAPCSGEGMFRKDPGAIVEWSVANVGECAIRQQMILRNIWDCLRPGGLLIYSTCTYNTEENENSAAYLHNDLGAEPLSVSIDPAWNIHKEMTGQIPAYRFMPHITKGEGLFLSVFRKPEKDIAERDFFSDRILRTEKRKNRNERDISVPEGIKSWILNPEDFCFGINQNMISAFPKQYEADLKLLNSRLNILHSGIPLAQLKGKEYFPEHALALSTCLNRNVFPVIDLNMEAALSFLRRESLQFRDHISKGCQLVTFENMPLGWIKSLGNRANNLYPQEWRIRSGYLPENNILFPL